MIGIHLIQYLTCPYKEEKFGAWRQIEEKECENTHEEFYLKVEAKIGMIQLEAKKNQGLLEVPETGRDEKGVYSESQKEQTLQTPITEF